MKGKRGRPPLPEQELIYTMRLAGQSNQQIADKLDLDYSQVANVVHRLITEDRIEKQRTGPVPTMPDEKLEERVIALRKKGCNDHKEIARRLKTSQSLVSKMLSKLLTEGRLEDQRGGVCGWRDLHNPRTQLIITLRKQRATFEKIGNALAVSGERARQLVALITKEYGEEIFAPDEQFWTMAEAVHEFQLTRDIIKKLCRAGKVSCRRRGLERNGAYLFDTTGMEQLKKYSQMTHEGICTICGQTFIKKVPGPMGRVCYTKACRLEYNRQRSSAYYARQCQKARKT